MYRRLLARISLAGAQVNLWPGGEVKTRVWRAGLAFGSRSVVVKLVCPLESPKELLSPLVPEWHSSQGGLDSRTVSKAPRGDSNVNRWSGTPSEEGLCFTPSSQSSYPKHTGSLWGISRTVGQGVQLSEQL